MRMSRFLVAATVVAACTTPTGGTDVGNGIVAVRLDAHGYDGRAVARSLVMVEGERLDVATITLRAIELEPGASCGDDGEGGEGGEGEGGESAEGEGEQDEVDVEGPVTADLVGAGFDPPLAFDVAAAGFCRIKMKLDASTGASLVLIGARADGTPFEVRAALDRDLELRSSGAPFVLDEGEAALLLAFDVGAWMDALALDDLAPGDDGVVRVDDDTEDPAASEALERLDDAIERGGRLVRDDDDDGELDDDEKDDPIAGD